MKPSWYWGAPVSLLVLAVLGCQSAPPAPPVPTPTQLAAQALQSVASPAAASVAQPTQPAAVRSSPAAGAASPAPAPSPRAAAKIEPKGKVVYALPYAISPAFLDPQEATQSGLPYAFGGYTMHDAMVKHLPGQPFAPSLAESYEIAPDFKSATFKLRPGLKFHNGDPVTSEDVKWTFENYRGTNAKRLKDPVERIETPDDRTVRFVFKQPFLDFLVLYGSAASGAGWIVPSKYYQQVGKDGFKKDPIGAGPYKLVRQVVGSEMELEAVPDYWRHPPYIKTLIIKSIPDSATRLAALQVGEIDLTFDLAQQSLEVLRQDPKLTTVIVQAPAIVYLEFPGFEQPDIVFHDKRLRQAASLALDRKALSDGEWNGLAPAASNFIPEDWPGALKVPPREENLAKAKQLMAEAGYPDGLDIGTLTPNSPIVSLGERVLAQLREIGIRGRINTLEVAAFYAALTKNQTPDRLRGIVLEFAGGAGDAAARIDGVATCQGARSPKCIPEVEEKFKRYNASSDPKEREQLIQDIQRYLLDEYIVVPVYRGIFLNAQGPRIANDTKEIWASIPQFQFVGPYEDIRLKDG